MHFCFVNMPIEYYSPISGGAISTIIAQTGDELLRRGHDVSILTAINEDPTHNIGRVVPLAVKKRDDLSFIQRRISGVRKRLGRWDWPYFESYLRSVKAALCNNQPQPDVVVLFNDLYTSPVIRKLVPKGRVLVWLQNEWRTDARNLPKTFAATDRFLTCSGYIKDWTVRTHAAPAEKFVVLPSGVDLKVFTSRADYLKPAAPVRVLFIGRIDRNKGPDLMLDAVAALKHEGLSVEATVAGGLWFYGNRDPMTDPFFRILHGKMESVGAKYLGHVTRPNVPELVRQHDIVCVLSRANEPFGLVVLEAMASGCAVLASNRGGLPEACGGAAILVDPDDRSAVDAALKSLVTDSAKLATIKRQSVARAAQASWSVTASLLEQAAA